MKAGEQDVKGVMFNWSLVIHTSTLPEGVLHILIHRLDYNSVCVKIIGEEFLVVDRQNDLIDIYNIKDGSWKRSIEGAFSSPQQYLTMDWHIITML
jgi:hypothetical protein